MHFSTLCLLAGPLLASALPSPYQISITVDNGKVTPAEMSRQASPLSDILPFTFTLAAHKGRDFHDHDSNSIPLGADPLGPMARISLGPSSKFKLVTNEDGLGQIVSADYTDEEIGLGQSPARVFPPIVSLVYGRFRPFVATPVRGRGDKTFLQLSQDVAVHDGGESVPSISIHAVLFFSIVGKNRQLI